MADKALTLGEFIEQNINENEQFEGQIVKIGSASAYFYYGTIGKLMDNVDSYDEKIEKCFRLIAQRTEGALAKAVNNPPTISQYVSDLIRKEDPEFSLSDYEKLMKRWFRMVLRKRQSRDEAIRKVEETKKLMKRKVIDSYPAREGIDDNTLIIIVEGFEIGQIWMGSEAKTLGCLAFNGVPEDETEE